VTEFKQNISAKSQIIEAIRLRDVRNYPSHNTNTLDTNDNGKFRCQDETCTLDPYIVLEEKTGTFSILACPISGDDVIAGVGHLKTGCKDNSSSLVGTCTNSTITTATCLENKNENNDINWVNLKRPSEIYPQFYVYGLTTFTRTWSGGTIQPVTPDAVTPITHNGTSSDENNATKYAPFANSTTGRRLLGRRGRRLKLHRRSAPSFEEESITLFVTIPSHETTVK